jgi:hypothetical protein
MGKEHFFQKNKLPVAAGLLVTLSVAAVFFLAIILYKFDGANNPVFVWFFSIDLTLVVIGTLILAFCIIRQWMICIDHANMWAEKEAENETQRERQRLLDKDAEARRPIELEREKVSDLFRLIDLAKDKREKSESIPGGEKSDKLLVRIIDKSEGLDLKKLETLIQHYNKIIPTNSNISNHV